MDWLLSASPFFVNSENPHIILHFNSAFPLPFSLCSLDRFPFFLFICLSHHCQFVSELNIVLGPLYSCNTSHKTNAFYISTSLPSSFPVNCPISSPPTLPLVAPLLHSYLCFFMSLWNTLFILAA